MNVRELIELLQEIEGEKEVYGFSFSTLYEIDAVDELEDRVDLNLKGLK